MVLCRCGSIADIKVSNQSCGFFQRCILITTDFVQSHNAEDEVNSGDVRLTVLNDNVLGFSTEVNRLQSAMSLFKILFLTMHLPIARWIRLYINIDLKKCLNTTFTITIRRSFSHAVQTSSTPTSYDRTMGCDGCDDFW